MSVGLSGVSKYYIIYKEAGYSFGGVIDIYSGRFFVLYHIPRKYLTLTQVEYIKGRFNGSYLGDFKYLLEIKGIKELKREISKILAINVRWIYFL